MSKNEWHAIGHSGIAHKPSFLRDPDACESKIHGLEVVVAVKGSQRKPLEDRNPPECVVGKDKNFSGAIGGCSTDIAFCAVRCYHRSKRCHSGPL